MIDRVLAGAMGLALEQSQFFQQRWEVGDGDQSAREQWQCFEVQLGLGMFGSYELDARILEGRRDPFRRVVVTDDLFDPVAPAASRRN